MEIFVETTARRVGRNIIVTRDYGNFYVDIEFGPMRMEEIEGKPGYKTLEFKQSIRILRVVEKERDYQI